MSETQTEQQQANTQPAWVEKLSKKWGRIYDLRWDISGMVCKLYRLANGTWVGGYNRIYVRVGAPSINARTEQVWERRRHGPSWSGLNLYITATVAPSWGQTVLAANLHIVDNELTLSARPLPAINDVRVWKAVWAQQSRGLSIVPVHGWIARIGDVMAKSTKSPRAAATTARRRLRAAVLDRFGGRE